MSYDYLVVGAGFAGATFARLMTDAGRRCLVIDKRTHIGGNAYTERREGIDVHRYGIHAFHTSSEKVWRFVTRFAEFNHYQHLVRANVEGFIYPLPINLMTMHQMWDVSTPEQARDLMACQLTSEQGTTSLEGWCIANIGQDLYEQLIEGYSFKQWGLHPSLLPASIVRRLPVRFDYREGYFTDRYQGVPVEGYTALFKKMLTGIEVILGCDFLKHMADLKLRHPDAKVVYTGPIDALFNHDLGRLNYRSLRFETDHLDTDDFQGIAQMNYPSASVPYTRILEHKHLNRLPGQKGTFVTYEFPEAYTGSNEPYYPFPSDANRELAQEYLARAAASGILTVGRLATYQYQDMHQVIAAAMALADKEIYGAA